MHCLHIVWGHPGKMTLKRKPSTKYLFLLDPEQHRSSWPLCKDDIQIHEAFLIYDDQSMLYAYTKMSHWNPLSYIIYASKSKNKDEKYFLQKEPIIRDWARCSRSCKVVFQWVAAALGKDYHSYACEYLDSLKLRSLYSQSFCIVACSISHRKNSWYNMLPVIWICGR